MTVGHRRQPTSRRRYVRGAVLTFPGRAAAGPAARPSTCTGCGWRCGSGATRTAPPLLLAHGGFDFAGTMDVFAPLLADAGWRVVCWDQRGHGDSDHALLYNWDADVRDAARRPRLDEPPSRPVRRALEGRQRRDAAGRRHAAPVQPPREPRRAAEPAQLARRRRPRTGAAARRRGAGRGSSTATRRATRRGARGRSTSWPSAAGTDEPAPAARLAALPRDHRRQGGRRRLALEDRPRPAHGRLRARGDRSGR